ncbi:hypothetical protein [Myroides odoratimimus]|uniref:hypothetical protein n=1 Tax=Myroides odoratimimus TaxID=76832 RepID=UPI002578DAF3|nr:hypothetical protein [Myroides odoratimimus]MDM1325890.1 hypothetical protein [Myroides odoratimimus]
MKNLLLIITLLTTSAIFAQRAEYGKLNKNNESYKEYLSKNGDLIKVGDTLIIGKAMDPQGFRYISQGGGRIHPTHGGKPFEITKIKSYGKTKSGFTIWLNFKGYGWLPVELDYENALEDGEVINPKGKPTKEQAIAKLKESKDLLDLEVITQEEYDKIKEEMTKYIK